MQKKKRQAEARKEKRKRPFEEKESYRWVEAGREVPLCQGWELHAFGN
ncbi:MAG: hypothetical protein ACRDEA_11655 [Microcystaceae cyanobacterium]